MKLFIIGCNGQLGKDMMLTAAEYNLDAGGMDFPDIDITNPHSIANAFSRHKPDVVINCAAHTAVDACETERTKAFAINGEGVRNIAEAAQRTDLKLVHISTDYVFDGTKTGPYVETDAPNPRSVYGMSKLAGEQELIKAYDRYFILRIAWLYGTRGANFLKTIRSLARKRAAAKEPLKVVNDQIGTPTYTRHVCNQILSLINTDLFGLYHATNEGMCSWYDFAKAIVSACEIPVVLLPCTTKEFPRPAPRPANSVLENEHLKKLGLNIMPNWEKGLEEYLEEEKTLAPS
jgi:dTDP-4-dehydrorhamnose reductase